MKNNVFTIITDIILVTLSFTIFIETVLEMRAIVLVKQKIFTKIFQNLDLEPISEIDVSRNSCNEDKGFTSFFSYEFPGIKTGSYDYLYEDFSDYFCGNIFECVNIPGITPQSLKIWEDKALCLKRMESTENKKIIIRSDANCPNRYKQCGIYNSFGDKFCLLEDIPCPINYIKITDNPLTGEGIISLPLYANLSLVYSNKFINDTLPINLIVSEGGYPCLEVDRYTYNNNFTIYPRMNNINSFGCNRTDYRDDTKIMDEGYDLRYTLLDTYSKRFFYNDNDLDQKYYELPEVDGWKNDLFNTTYYLYHRSYISLSHTCIEGESMKYFKTTLEDLKLMKFSQMLVALGNLILLFIFISLLSLVRVIVNRVWHVLFSCLKNFMSIAYVIYNIVQSHKNIQISQDLIWFIYSIWINGCIDDYTQYAMIRYEVIFNILQIYDVNKYLYIFSFIYMGFAMIQLIRLIYKVYIRFKNRDRRKIAKLQLGRAKTEDNKVLLL
jgi:hypothetical protein